MFIDIECECGNPLEVVKIESLGDKVYLVIKECSGCEKVNYEAGEADAKTQSDNDNL